MLNQVGSLKKSPLSVETLEKICLAELNILKIIIKKKKNIEFYCYTIGRL